MNIDKIKNANTKILGKNVIYYDEISSTQDIIRNLAEKHVENGTIVIADNQVNGKGTKGRTWVSEKNDILEFHEDGSCVAPFTYNRAWLESADRYTVKDDGTLLLSSAGGHTDSSYELTDSEEEALDNRSQYFVSKETLVIDGDEYTKTE